MKVPKKGVLSRTSAKQNTARHMARDVAAHAGPAYSLTALSALRALLVETAKLRVVNVDPALTKAHRAAAQALRDLDAEYDVARVDRARMAFADNDNYEVDDVPVCSGAFVQIWVVP